MKSQRQKKLKRHQKKKREKLHKRKPHKTIREFQQKLLRPEENGMMYSKCSKKKNVNQEYYAQQTMPFNNEGEINIFLSKQKLRNSSH